MSNWEQTIGGNAVVVYSRKLESPNHSKHDKVFVINKSTFAVQLESKGGFLDSDSKLCQLKYGEDHVILLESIYSLLLDGTDFAEYKVLTKDGVGYMLFNKSHEYFQVIA
jgi:hypothetical protein